MKFIFTFLFVFVVLTQTANAQAFGIKGRLNVASMSFSKSEQAFSPKPIIGFQFGPILYFILNKNLYFNSGLFHSVKGTKLNMMGYPISEDFVVGQINLNYL